MKRVSIAMATYNGAAYLQEQLDSFVVQSQLPDELIVCDDDSTDLTYDILENFMAVAPFPVILYKNSKNLGYTKNFEKAMSLCEGDVIFLSDQDDVWFPEKIETMTGIISRRDSIFVLQADMILTDKRLNPTKYTQLGNILALNGRSDTFLSGCGSAIRKEWLELVLPIPSTLDGHDSWIHRLALALGVRGLHGQPLQYYRRHEGNTSEWLASRPERVSEMKAFALHGLSDATLGWQREVEVLSMCHTRLSDGEEVLGGLGLVDRRATALASLQEKIENLNGRIGSMSVPRHRRLPYIVKLWRRGGYSDFSGWKSFIKDIFRP